MHDTSANTPMAGNVSNNSYYVHLSDDVIIWTMNNKLARHSIPAIIFMWTIFILGMPGNALVLYVYHYNFKTTTSNMCIKFLAFLDIFYLCLGLPVETVDMAFPIMHGTVVTCSVLRTIELNAAVAASMMRVCVGYDRYCHICKPFERLYVLKMQRIFVGIMVTSTIVTAPAFVILGPHSYTVNGIVTKGCSYDDRMNNTVFSYAYVAVIGLVYFSWFCLIVIFYVRIGITIRRWQRRDFGSGRVNSSSVATIHSIKSTVSNSAIPGQDDSIVTISPAVTPTSGRDTNGRSGMVPPSLMVNRTRRKTKTTKIFCAVSLTFVITYTPYFITELILITGYITFEALSLPAAQLMEIWNKSYFITTVANPLIYTLLNPSFRIACIDVFRSNTPRVNSVP